MFYPKRLLRSFLLVFFIFLILFHVGMGHVRVGTVFQEKLDHLLVAFFGGYAQRAGSCFIMGIYVGGGGRQFTLIYSEMRSAAYRNA